MNDEHKPVDADDHVGTFNLGDAMIASLRRRQDEASQEHAKWLQDLNRRRSVRYSKPRRPSDIV